jgi:hypothetical protein
VCRDLKNLIVSPEFKARFQLDNHKSCLDDFTGSVEKESAGRVKVYADKDGPWFATSTNLGKAISDATTLPLLAMGKVKLWISDPSLDCWDMGKTDDAATYHDFQRAHSKALVQRRRALAAAEEAKDESAVARLALEECQARGWIHNEDALNAPDEYLGQTPVYAQAFLGEWHVVKCLLQAKANPDAVPTNDPMRQTPLLCAAKAGHDDVARVLLDFKANVHATDMVHTCVCVCVVCVCVCMIQYIDPLLYIYTY